MLQAADNINWNSLVLQISVQVFLAKKTKTKVILKFIMNKIIIGTTLKDDRGKTKKKCISLVTLSNINNNI